MRQTASLIFLLTAMLFLNNRLYAEEGKTFKEGYKNAKWGMSIEEVKSLFPDATIKDLKEGFAFPAEIGGKEVITMFAFKDDKLFKVVLGFQIQTSNSNKYTQAYEDLEEALKEKYGKPSKSFKSKSDNRFMTDAEYISYGKGAYFASWDTQETQIGLILDGDNSKLNLSIHYECKELMKKASQAQKKKQQDDL